MNEGLVDIDLESAWTFTRRQDRLTIRREQTDQCWQLVVVDRGRSRVFAFTDPTRLVVFQDDMEAFLVRTGWTLAAFDPDRRRGSDRRGLPRKTSDRRRWWTDGLRQSASPSRSSR